MFAFVVFLRVQIIETSVKSRINIRRLPVQQPFPFLMGGVHLALESAAKSLCMFLSNITDVASENVSIQTFLIETGG